MQKQSSQFLLASINLCQMFLSFFILRNFLFTRSIQMVFSILLQHHMSKGTTDLLSEVSKFQHLHYIRFLKMKVSFFSTT